MFFTSCMEVGFSIVFMVFSVSLTTVTEQLCDTVNRQNMICLDPKNRKVIKGSKAV